MSPYLPLALLFATTAASHSTGGANLPPEVSEVLSQALAIAGARIVPVDWSARLPAGCLLHKATLDGAITGSGRLPVKLYGQGCTGWGWVRFEVWAPTAITTRPVRAGERLQPALAVEDREVRNGHATVMPPPGATAARALPRGTVLETSHIAGATVASGESVKVIVMSGPLAIEVQGRAISCGAGRTCAVLPSGRHVEGHVEDGRLMVDVP
jgi:flagella basal body P-ring formation protein FlgA